LLLARTTRTLIYDKWLMKILSIFRDNIDENINRY